MGFNIIQYNSIDTELVEYFNLLPAVSAATLNDYNGLHSINWFLYCSSHSHMRNVTDLTNHRWILYKTCSHVFASNFSSVHPDDLKRCFGANVAKIVCHKLFNVSRIEIKNF